ncbi:MAG: c-type cytochrome [Nitrospiraceae bacterium]
MALPAYLNPFRVWFYLTLAFIVLPIAGAGWFAYENFTSGFAAKDSKPHPAEIFAARLVRKLAIPAEQRQAKNPVIQTPAILKESLAHFADHCAVCHANNGSGDTPIGKNVYPPAPDLRGPDTQGMSDGELFWAIHYGIRFTAMPGWGSGDPSKDLDSWKLVHFIRHLPSISPAELEEMRGLNPKSAHHAADEAAADAFLSGEDEAPAHHH